MPIEIAKNIRDAVVGLEVLTPVSINLSSDTVLWVKNKFQWYLNAGKLPLAEN